MPLSLASEAINANFHFPLHFPLKRHLESTPRVAFCSFGNGSKAALFAIHDTWLDLSIFSDPYLHATWLALPMFLEDQTCGLQERAKGKQKF